MFDRVISSKSRPEVRFAIFFLLTAGVLFSVYSFPYAQNSWPQRWSDLYLRAYARMAGGVLSLFEPHITVTGQNILGRYPLRIIRGCDAVDAQILLVAAILATHACSWRRRVGGAVAGVALVTVANVVRICSLYYVGYFLPGSFEFFHHELWPLVLIVIAAGTFVLWFRVANVGTHLERPLGS